MEAAQRWRDQNDPSYRVWKAWYERDSERVQRAFRGELAPPPQAAEARSPVPAPACRKLITLRTKHVRAFGSFTDKILIARAW